MLGVPTMMPAHIENLKACTRLPGAPPPDGMDLVRKAAIDMNHEEQQTRNANRRQQPAQTEAATVAALQSENARLRADAVKASNPSAKPWHDTDQTGRAGGRGNGGGRKFCGRDRDGGRGCGRNSTFEDSGHNGQPPSVTRGSSGPARGHGCGPGAN